MTATLQGVTQASRTVASTTNLKLAVQVRVRPIGVTQSIPAALPSAEARYRDADSRGSAFNLGVLLEKRDELESAEAAYRRADERGSAEAARKLGMLLEGRGDLERAEAAYRRAEGRGQRAGSYFLGMLLQLRGDRNGAQAAYARAEARPATTARPQRPTSRRSVPAVDPTPAARDGRDSDTDPVSPKRGHVRRGSRPRTTHNSRGVTGFRRNTTAATDTPLPGKSFERWKCRAR